MAKKTKHKVCVNVPGDCMRTHIESHEILEQAILNAAAGIGFSNKSKVIAHDGFYACTIAGNSDPMKIDDGSEHHIEVHAFKRGVWSVPDWSLIEDAQQVAHEG